MEEILKKNFPKFLAIKLLLVLCLGMNSCASYQIFKDQLFADDEEKEKSFQTPFGHGIELDLYNRLYCKAGGQPFIKVAESSEHEGTSYSYKCKGKPSLLLLQNIDGLKIPVNSDVYLISSDAYLHYKKSLNLLKSGMLDNALIEIERALSIDFNVDYFWATRAEIFLRQNNQEQAIFCINKVLKISSNHFNLVLAGYFSFLVGNQEKGMRMAQKSISNWPEDERGYAYALCRYARMLHMSSRIVEGSYHMHASCKMGAFECCALLR